MKKVILILLLIFGSTVFAQDSSAIDRAIKRNLILMDSAKYNQAIRGFDSIMPSLKGLKRADALVSVGASYRNLSEYDKSIKSFFGALSFYDDLKYKPGQCKVYSAIGIVYYYKSDIKSALQYESRALMLAQELKDTLEIAKIYNNFSICYNGVALIDSCITNSKKSLELAKLVNNKQLILSNYQNLSWYYFSVGNLDKAELYIKLSLEITEKIGPPKLLANNLGVLGSIFSEQNKITQAKECFDRAYDIAKKLGDVYLLGSICTELCAFHKKTGDFKQALYFNELQANYYDSIMNKESVKKIEELNATYEFDKLHKESEIKDLEVEKKNQTVNYLVVIASFTLFIVIAIGYGYTRKKKANSELQSKNKIIEEKNHEIQDSINYAQKIQETILPRNVDDENKFILFQPKDVVSGDFYWHKKPGDRMYIAAADCTGHGVPGALMSIINNEILNNALNEHNLPCNILSHANDNLLNRMAETQRQDGMDIGMIMYDEKTKQLMYSGAKRPLYLVRNGVLTEYKGSKFSIGGNTPYGSEFDMHTIEVQEGDCFYVTTDGFVDQFGGTNNKKYSTKKFKDFLTTIFALTAGEQREALRNEIRFWKGTTEQTDDICVIGIKI